MRRSVGSWGIANGLVELDLLEVGGHIGPIRFHSEGMTHEPMHIAPWTDDPDASRLPMLQHLRGDFFCAPFGANDLGGTETRDHGLTANGTWRQVQRSDSRLELELEGRVCGATVRKDVWLEPGQPLVYQRHTFEGGSGTLPLGHHAMLRAPEGEQLLLSFSRFSWAGTPPEPVEIDSTLGRSLLLYPQSFGSLKRVETAAREHVDLSRYPVLAGSEEILMLVTDPAEQLGWSAVVAPASRWVWFSLRPNRVLRSTLLWLSNGGRNYPPFLGRHKRVIGIEEVTSFFHLGHRASTQPNDLTVQGIPTAVELPASEQLEVRYVFGAVTTPPGFDRVEAVTVTADDLILIDITGQEIRVPITGEFVLS